MLIISIKCITSLLIACLNLNRISLACLTTWHGRDNILNLIFLEKLITPRLIVIADKILMKLYAKLDIKP